MNDGLSGQPPREGPSTQGPREGSSPQGPGGPWGPPPFPGEQVSGFGRNIPPPAVAPPRRRRSIWAVLATILLLLSVLVNVVLLVAVIGLVSSLMVGGIGEAPIQELVIQKGPASTKVAVIRLEGIIDEEMVTSLDKQTRRAAEDNNVKAVILLIDSPGGGLTASDALHHQVKTRLADRGKPVIVAMDSVAASGGYYVACAADTIVAQPTTITGSIGVVAQFFFLRTLMTDKLGITPVTLKMGEQKDWPNIFGDTELSEEQRWYLMDTLLVPGYERFVDVVAEGRAMDRDRVLELATGRIFMAAEAREVGLVDEVGYFERAVEIAKEAAGVDKARVVEYVEPFNFGRLLGLSAKAERMMNMTPERLAALASPKVMYLWTGF
ncbi:MAG: signal peptide peptidase SppA [Phycisphaerae bacterium]